jgi:hypothetical protein
LITYTHDSELQATAAPPLISTIHKSQQHTLSLLQTAMSSSAVPWQRPLTVDILQLHALKSSIHRLPYRTQLSTNYLQDWRPFHTYLLIFSSEPLAYTILARTTTETPVPTVTAQLLHCSFQRERVYRAAAQKRFWYIRPSRDLCTATATYATIFRHIVSIKYRHLNTIVWAVFEKIAILYFEAHLKLKCSHSPSTDL